MDYSSMSNEELLTLYNESVRLSQTYDIAQKAEKVLLNSLYGALGNNHFLLYTHEMARGIPLMGRCLIRKAAKAKNEYISKLMHDKEPKDRLIYSDTDSCTGDSIININGMDTPIEKFFSDSDGEIIENEDNKQVKMLPQGRYEVLTYYDKTIHMPVRYVMKHKVKKHLWKLSVNGNSVTVTEDHSLVFLRDDKLMKGTVKDIRKGDKIISIGEKK